MPYHRPALKAFTPQWLLSFPSPLIVANTFQPELNMCADDDVVYLYTIRRSVVPPASATDTSPISSNRTERLAVRRHRSRDTRVSPLQRRRSSRSNRHKPRATVRKAKPRWTIPYEIRNKCVRLGCAPNAVNGEHESVFGMFDAAGRFCRRIGTKLPSSESIKHKNIKYFERFSGLSNIQVRYKVLQLLMAKYGPTLGPGEI